MNGLRSTALVAAVILSLHGCEAPRTGRTASVVAGTPLGLSETPVVIVGERPGDPAHEFFAVRTPFLLRGGGVGVPLSDDATIRLFDSRGEFVGSLGAEGQGPGEFVRLGAAWTRGDTIEAFDPESHRVTRFPPGGPPETVALDGVASAQTAVPGLADGSWILYGVQEVRPTGRDVIAVHRFAPDGRHLGMLLRTDGFRRHEFPGGRGPDPISPRAVVRTEGQWVYVAETLTPSIAVRNVTTNETTDVRWAVGAGIEGSEAARIAREALKDAGLSEGQLGWALASFEALSGSEVAPVFWDFLVDGEKFVWVRGYDPAIHATHAGGLGRTGPGGVWVVLSREGNKVGEVEMPRDFEPLSIDGDQLIGVRRDAVDVESVRVYRIERSGGG